MRWRRSSASCCASERWPDVLRTNLSTRPFYNERAIKVAIGIGVLLTAGLTAFNAAEIVSLNRRNGELVARAEASESRARASRGLAQVVRQALNREDIQTIQEQAREANLLIDRRAFSWTDLFNRFEETLPPEVRIVAVAPQVDNEGRRLVAVTVIARNAEYLEKLIDGLEATGAFTEVLSRQDNTEEDGTLKATIQGYYNQSNRRTEAVSTPPASDSSDAAGNRSPANRTPDNRTPAKPPAGVAR
jgi:hypothetical protein